MSYGYAVPTGVVMQPQQVMMAPQQPGYFVQPTYAVPVGYAMPAATDPAWEQFKACDMDHNGTVSPKELQNMLAATGLVLSMQTCAQLVKLHNKRSNPNDSTPDALNYDEFKEMQTFLNNVRGSFEHFDRSKNGALDAGECTQALQHAGFGNVEQTAVATAMKAFDPDQSFSLSLDQYIAFSLFFFGARKAFDALDRSDATQVGRITIDFNQFVYAMSMTR